MSLCLWVGLEFVVSGFVGGADGAASYGTSAIVAIVANGVWAVASVEFTNKQTTIN